MIEARLGRIIKVDLKYAPLSWDINEDALAQARLMDGKLLLLTTISAEMAQLFTSLKLPKPTTKNI